MRRLRRQWPTLAIGVLGLLVADACRHEPDLATILARHGLAIDQAVDFTGPFEVHQLPGTGSISVTGRRQERTLRVRISGPLSREEALYLIEEQAALLESIFEPRLPPYPEFLTRETGCPQAYFPEVREAPFGPYRLLFAGERLGFGVCVDDLVRYRAAVADLHCERSGRVFTVEYFVPARVAVEELEEFMNGIACR